MKTACIAALGVAILLRAAAAGAVTDDRDYPVAGQLTTYEPTYVGLTSDSDDVRFMDFKVSVKYPLFPEVLFAKHLPDYRAFFAFTGRFGQYIGTRDSSPVIGKRFSPKLILRRYLERHKGLERDHDYLDFAYVHESNGQSIDTKDEYHAAIADAEENHQPTDYVNDELSRGWDYLEVVWKRVLKLPGGGTGPSATSAYLQLRYFLSNGLLQGKPEEYSDWQMHPEGKPRKAVNGIGLLVKHEFRTGKFWYFRDPKLAASFETGYSPAFRYPTYRVEAGAYLVDLPVTFWAQTGYGSDLAQYYKKVSSWGIQVEIGSY